MITELLNASIHNVYFLWLIITGLAILLPVLEISRRASETTAKQSYSMVATAQSAQAQAEETAKQWLSQSQQHEATIAQLQQSDSQQLADMRGQLDSTIQRFTTLQQENERLNNDVSSLHTQLSADVENRDSQIEALRAELRVAKNEQEKAVSDHKQVQVNHDQVLEQVTSITAERDELITQRDSILAERDSLLVAKTKAKPKKAKVSRSARSRDIKSEIIAYLKENPGAPKTRVTKELNIGSPNTTRAHWPSDSELGLEPEPELPMAQLLPAGAD